MGSWPHVWRTSWDERCSTFHAQRADLGVCEGEELHCTGRTWTQSWRSSMPRMSRWQAACKHVSSKFFLCCPNTSMDPCRFGTMCWRPLCHHVHPCSCNRGLKWAETWAFLAGRLRFEKQIEQQSKPHNADLNKRQLICFSEQSTHRLWGGCVNTVWQRGLLQVVVLLILIRCSSPV